MAPALDEWTLADELLVMRLLFSAFPLRMFMCACDVTASLREFAVKKPVHVRICTFILLCAHIHIHTMHINLSCYFDAAVAAAFFIQIRLFPTFGFGAQCSQNGADLSHTLRAFRLFTECNAESVRGVLRLISTNANIMSFFARLSFWLFGFRRGHSPSEGLWIHLRDRIPRTPGR
jgi:hypothetical protein